MKKNFRNLAFLLGGTCLIGLTSCGCFNMFNSRITFEINSNIENGKVNILNYFRPLEETIANDAIKVEAIADDGYKLDKLLLNGEDISSTPRIRIGKTNHYKIDASFVPFTPTKINGSFDENKTTYETINSTQGLGTIPNKGKSKILVVPVEFLDFKPFTDTQIKNIDACFNGTNKDGTNDYWESVSSFYSKSSYGNVDLEFTICDTYVPSMSSTEFIKMESNDSAKGNYKILDDLYEKIKVRGRKVDYKDYDANNDGRVDGVWLIHNYDNKDGVFKNNYFWAYCHVYTKSMPNLERPTFSRYANCSQAFLYQGDKNGHDAHTLIHETGHMFGLDDYYSYDTKREGKVNYPVLGAVGGIDMMDLNIGDHNAFSKFALGWVNPYKVNKDIDIQLKPFQETGECVVLPIYPATRSAFNEYVILEYYTPTNLNELDAKHSYLNKYPNVYKKPGVKIWHIDAKLMDSHLKDQGDVCDKLIPFDELTDEDLRVIGLSNTASRNPYQFQKDGRHNLIEAITPDNIRTYDNDYLGHFKNKQRIRGLFIPGDVFNYQNNFNFFIDGNRLHEKQFPFNWQVRVENLNSEYASISIKKIA